MGKRRYLKATIDRCPKHKAPISSEDCKFCDDKGIIYETLRANRPYKFTVACNFPGYTNKGKIKS